MERGKVPYDKSIFEQTQSRKVQKPLVSPDPALCLIVSDMAVGDWHSVFLAAEKAGRGQLALYRMRQFLNDLVESLGKDDEEFLRVKTEMPLRTFADGSAWTYTSAESLELDGLGGVLLQMVSGPRKQPSQRQHKADAR